MFEDAELTLGRHPGRTSNTILFVEAAKAVPWTKPEDMTFDDGKLLPKLGGLSEAAASWRRCVTDPSAFSR